MALGWHLVLARVVCKGEAMPGRVIGGSQPHFFLLFLPPLFFAASHGPSHSMSNDEEPRIEEIDDDGPPPLEEVSGGLPAGLEDMDESRGQSKSEKKTRKAVEKLGLKKVNGINKVSIKKQKSVFVILMPDVYRTAKGDGYVVFGEAKVEDSSAQSLANAFSQGGMPDFSQGMPSMGDEDGPPPLAGGAGGADDDDDDDEGPPGLVGGNDDGPPGLVESDAAAGGDETGVEQKDIDLVMAQVNCTRAQAVGALRKHDSDIVNAIMELQE